MPEHILTVTHNGETSKISASSGESLLDALRNAGYSGIHAPCGGNGTCRQCRVSVTGTLRALTGGEKNDAKSEELLACRWSAGSDLEIIIPDTAKMEVLTRGVTDIAPCGSGLGVAADIGTTTVAAFLFDLETGRRLAVESGRNAQRPFGADVISRIHYSSQEGGLQRLAGAVRSQLDEAINSLCAGAMRDRGEITRVSIAANTVMEHLFMRLSPETIGVSPFTPLSLFGEASPASDVFNGLALNAELYMCPALAGYVGGDITAGLLSSGAWALEETCLYLDIGTNGEMGLGNRDGYICCATAAGPAFEGAEIECGMDASPGAINRVSYDGGDISFETIGGAEAKGICGSGLIDALASMLRCGAVEESGRMSPPEDAPENIRRRLRRDEAGKMRFHLTDSVYVSAEDVRQLQLAKSAIRAGAETLLKTRGQKYSDIENVLIAGGFGSYMDVRSACAIGLLPPVLMEKTRHVGNAAGGGAALALSPSARKGLEDFTIRCEYLELSSSRLFMDTYIESMIFDEAEEVGF